MIVTWAINTGALLLLAWILPGFSIESWGSGLALAALLGLLNALVWPLLIRVALPLTVITLGFGVLLLNGVFVWLASDILADSVQISGLWTAVVVAIGLTLINNVVTLFLGIDDDDLYYREVIKRHAREAKDAAAPSDVPGVLFLEIDGLAHDVLVRAMRDGSAPTMAGWLRNGSHSMIEWECDWSSQTGAMQSGILQGSNWDMPGFRWWEKDRQEAFVSNSPKNAREIEKRHSNGKGLLYADGASRANLVSGDAPHSMITMSTLREKREGRVGEDYFAFFANPYDVTRTLILAVKEIVAELWQQTQQRRLEIEPRVHRGWFPYPLLRAYTNVLQRELEVAATIQDLYSGRPVIYTMFLGYDEVAHHSGIERPETLRELAKIDRAFARLARAAEDAPRPYRIVVLADHGQSQGATFKQRYGLSLGDLVTEKCGADEVLVPGGVDEGWGYLNAAATEGASSSGVTGALTRLVTKNATAEDGTVDMGAARDESGRKRRHREKKGAEGPPEVTVMASGCLGLISFPRIEGRATLEQLDDSLPRPRRGAPHAPRNRLRARPLRQARSRRSRARRHELPGREAHRGRRPACLVRPQRRAAREAHRHLPPLPGHHGQQHLLDRCRRGRRLRRALRLTRGHGRHPEPPLHPLPLRLGAAVAAARRRRERPPPVRALARRPRPYRLRRPAGRAAPTRPATGRRSCAAGRVA